MPQTLEDYGFIAFNQDAVPCNAVLRDDQKTKSVGIYKTWVEFYKGETVGTMKSGEATILGFNVTAWSDENGNHVYFIAETFDEDHKYRWIAAMGCLPGVYSDEEINAMKEAFFDWLDQQTLEYTIAGEDQRQWAKKCREHGGILVQQ